MVAIDEVEAEEVDSTYSAKGIYNFGKDTEAIEEPSQEEGASTPNKVGGQRHLHATIVANSAIAKRSGEEDEASRLQQVGNSQIMPQTWNTRTTAGSS